MDGFLKGRAWRELVEGTAAAAALQQSSQLAVAGEAAKQLPVPAPTPWGPAAAVLLCLLPIALLLLVTLVRRLSLPSSTSLPAAAALLAVIRLAYLASPPLFVLGSVARGMLESLTPLSVIYGAILLFEAMQHTKCLPWMMHQVKSLSAGEPLAEVFLIGWAFAFMISGVGGFNTPIALSAPMLASLGHDPIMSLLVVVMLNTLASHIGSVGMAIWFGFKTLGLGQANILLICLKSAIIVGAISYIMAPIAVSFLVPWGQILRCSFFVVLSITSAVLPTALFSIFSAEFPVLIGGVCGIIGTTVLAYYRIGLGPNTDWQPKTLALDTLKDYNTTLVQVAVDSSAAAAAAAGFGSSGSSSPGVWQRLLQVFKRVSSRGGVNEGDTVITAENNNFQMLDIGLLRPVPPAVMEVPDAGVEMSHPVPGITNPDSGTSGHQGSNGSTHSNPSTRATNHSDGILIDREPLRSSVELHHLATVSCPAAYNSNPHHGITYPWDDGDDVSVDAESDGVSNPVAGLGCEGLWEDNHSAMLTVLPASLVAATIHHAALSGVSRVPWFAGLGHSIISAAAGAFGQQRQQQQQVQDVYHDSSRGSSAEIEPAAAAAGTRPLVQWQQQQQSNMECGMPDFNGPLEPQHSIAAATAAAAMELGYSGLLQQQREHQRQQQHQQWWHNLLKHSTRLRRKHKRPGSKGLPGLRVMFWRTLPIWLTVLLLLITRIPQLRIQAALQSTQPSATLQLGSLGTFMLSPSLVLQLQELFMLPNVSWIYEVFYVPCLLPFVAASVVTMIVHRKDLRDQQLTWAVPFQHAWHKMQGTFSAMIGAMVLSELISAGGTGAPAFIIGYYLSSWMGKGYLAIAGFLGALGSFVSGSVMAGNMTFGAIQKVAAERIGVSVTSMLAVQTAGSCAGKMMCISNILSAKVMMDLHNMKEGKIIRKTTPLAVMFVLLAQALGLIFTLGGVWPDQPIPSS